MRPPLSVRCLFAISEITEIIEGIPRGHAWAATPHITQRRAWMVSYRRYWKTSI